MDADTSGIPVLSFHGADMPAEEAFELYHDTTAPLFDAGLTRDAAGFRSIATDYLVDDIVVSRITASPHTLRRSHEHLRDGATDWITVQVHHSGGFGGAIGPDATLELDRSRIGIVDFAQPFSLASRGGTATWVALPRERIDRADQLGPVCHLEVSDPRARVLSAAVSDLWRQLETASAGQATVLADSVTQTVNTVLSPNGFTPTNHDLTLAMQDYVKVNLSDLDLDVGSLRQAFHCSRSSVYRAFEPHGGVANYIRDQRLLRCFDALTRPAMLPRRVSEIATRWGFDNPSHFNRVFKAKFGFPPSALRPVSAADRRRGAQSPAASSQIREFHMWASHS